MELGHHSAEALEKLTYAEFKNQLRSAFVAIDRKQEDKDVVSFQKSGDMLLLENIYKNRITTIRIWANRYHYMSSSAEDLFEELSFSFIKAIHGYDKKKGSFNTFLYTSLLNCVRNIRSGLLAKKRTPENHDGSLRGFLLSLDYNYSDDENGETTLKDIIADEMVSDEESSKQIRFDETVESLACGDEVLKGFFVKLSQGSTVNALIRECKTHEGKINLNTQMAQKLGRRKCTRIVSDLIKQRKRIKDDFDLINYYVGSNSLYYTIEMRNSKEADHLVKSIRKIRKNKDHYMARIG